MADISTLAPNKSTHPVVVYGATGYTGHLICEYVAKLGLAFTVAGRNQAKLDAMAKQFTAQGHKCSAMAVPHTDVGLKSLLKDADVVVNVSGPFSLLGKAVVEAALACDCHYIDTTGEQDFMLEIRQEYGPRFKAKSLILAPSTSYLWGLGVLAVDLCLQHPGISDLSVVYAPPSLQTMASLQSMWRTTRRDGFSIAKGKLNLLPTAELSKKKLPDGRTVKALRIGTGEPTFLLDQAEVQSCEVYFASDTLAKVVPVFKLWKLLMAFVSGDTLDRWSDKLVETFKRNPEREEPESGRFVVHTVGQGSGGRVEVVMNGTSPYLLTGFLCAVGAQAVLEGKILQRGYVSIAESFGTDYMIKRLEEVGTYTIVNTQLKTSATVRPLGQSKSA